jgi:hypothetical protein
MAAGEPDDLRQTVKHTFRVRLQWKAEQMRQGFLQDRGRQQAAAFMVTQDPRDFDAEVVRHPAAATYKSFFSSDCQPARL